jgi:hypothetical protein
MLIRAVMPTRLTIERKDVPVESLKSGTHWRASA